MPEISTLAVFSLAAGLVVIAPGPSVLYIVARSVDQGRVAGIVSTLGVATGALVHIAAAALGVSVIVASSAVAFGLIKYIGAAYLVYLGARALLERGPLRAPTGSTRHRLSRLFYDGVIMEAFNPKTALFFFAFLPQFVDVSKGSVPAQMLILGAIFVTLGILSDGLWALFAGTTASWLRHRPGFSMFQRVFSGSVLIALGITTALVDLRRA